RDRRPRIVVWSPSNAPPRRHGRAERESARLHGWRYDLEQGLAQGRSALPPECEIADNLNDFSRDNLTPNLAFRPERQIPEGELAIDCNECGTFIPRGGTMGECDAETYRIRDHIAADSSPYAVLWLGLCRLTARRATANSTVSSQS